MGHPQSRPRVGSSQVKPLQGAADRLAAGVWGVVCRAHSPGWGQDGRKTQHLEGPACRLVGAAGQAGQGGAPAWHPRLSEAEAARLQHPASASSKEREAWESGCEQRPTALLGASRMLPTGLNLASYPCLAKGCLSLSPAATLSRDVLTQLAQEPPKGRVSTPLGVCGTSWRWDAGDSWPLAPSC